MNKDVNVKVNMLVKNVPDYAMTKEHEWWVITVLNGEFWFFGAFPTSENSHKCIEESPNGEAMIIIHRDE